MKLPAFYTNIKNNLTYYAHSIITSTTNGQEGIQKVLYYPVLDDIIGWNKGYERELQEFKTKFKIKE